MFHHYSLLGYKLGSGLFCYFRSSILLFPLILTFYCVGHSAEFRRYRICFRIGLTGDLATTMPYPCHIPVISLPYPCHIPAISQPYPCHIPAISLPYPCHTLPDPNRSQQIPTDPTRSGRFPFATDCYWLPLIATHCH